MHKLPHADGGRVAVAGHPEVHQVAVGEIGAGGHGGHAAVHRVEAVGVAQKVSGRFGGAADAGELRHVVRLNGHLEAGLHDGGTDRVVAAAGAEGGEGALVLFLGVADFIFRQLRVPK